jgi:hypothetical protein
MAEARVVDPKLTGLGYLGYRPRLIDPTWLTIMDFRQA